MICRRILFLFAAFACLGAVALAAGAVVTQSRKKGPAQEARPNIAPSPVPAAAPVTLDHSKDQIESPAKRAIANNSSGTAAAAEAGPLKVASGKVQWHDTFAEACSSARKSRKPVLLFQMMGQLDEQFC